jgi:hypothetical protein
MNHLKSVLTQPILHTDARFWHLLALLVAVWIAPAFLPDIFWQNYAIYILIVWTILYFALSRMMRSMMRLTALDAILIERFFILLSFLVPLIGGVFYGVRHGFGGLLLVFIAVDFAVSGLLALGIAIHLKSASKYYHGIKKDELFK